MKITLKDVILNDVYLKDGEVILWYNTRDTVFAEKVFKVLNVIPKDAENIENENYIGIEFTISMVDGSLNESYVQAEYEYESGVVNGENYAIESVVDISELVKDAGRVIVQKGK